MRLADDGKLHVRRAFAVRKKLVLVRLWNDPLDDQLIGTLLRLLELYATIALPRREADRRFKKRPDFGRGASRQTDSGAATRQFKEVPDPRLLDVIAVSIERKKHGCRECGCVPRGHLTITRCYQDQVKVELSCGRHSFRRCFKFSAEQLRRAAAAEADEE